MTSRPAPTSSDFNVLDYALACFAPGELITIDDVREPLEIAQIRPTRWGPMFAEAVRHGLISTDGGTRKSRHPASHGRRVLVYKIAGQKADRPKIVHTQAAA